MAGVSGLWLAIDTATDTASVAVGRPPHVTAGAHAAGARRHAAEIIGLVEFVLRRAGARPADLEGVVLGDGPGSFTGLRIGWAAAKGLAHEAGLEARAIPSLLAAAAAGAEAAGGPVAACFDALRGQVYGAVYDVGPERVETLVAPAVLTIAELERVSPVRPRIVVGDGAERYAGEVERWTGRAGVPAGRLPPLAPILMALLTRAGAAHPIADLATAEPAYGRPAEAQARWEARHGRPLPRSPGTPR